MLGFTSSTIIDSVSPLLLLLHTKSKCKTTKFLELQVDFFLLEWIIDMNVNGKAEKPITTMKIELDCALQCYAHTNSSHGRGGEKTTATKQMMKAKNHRWRSRFCVYEIDSRLPRRNDFVFIFEVPVWVLRIYITVDLIWVFFTKKMMESCFFNSISRAMYCASQWTK